MNKLVVEYSAQDRVQRREVEDTEASIIALMYHSGQYDLSETIEFFSVEGEHLAPLVHENGDVEFVPSDEVDWALQ